MFNKKRMSHCLVSYGILLCRMDVRTFVHELVKGEELYIYIKHIASVRILMLDNITIYVVQKRFRNKQYA